MPGGMTRLNSLRHVSFSDCENLAALPEAIKYLTCLQTLNIFSCPALETLPEWLGNLVALREMELCYCENLLRLPQSMQRLTALQFLLIRGCPCLEMRCKKDTGADWHKIRHIPFIKINGPYIQALSDSKTLQIQMMRLLTATFRSVKHPNPDFIKPSSSLSSGSSPIAKSKTKSWCVYLILSTNAPIKTYVGVTTDFSRRLKQHNGELKGGAKASRAGRPWICACIIRGFNDQSEACEFESKWKRFSRKLPCKRKNSDLTKEVDEDDGSLTLLQHRQTALNRVKGSLDCSHLEIDWQLNTS
ncbi:GIY-YIG endonuclease - like 1 [Theobroma cacao]|nr:GIY-YIG endonuclease - like 1 [Theobroma cacao]